MEDFLYFLLFPSDRHRLSPKVYFFFLLYCFHNLANIGKKIARSRVSITAPSDNDFINQKILTYNETWSFDYEDIGSLRANEAFPTDTIFKPYDASIQLDFVSPSWVCFPEYPFSLGFRYPFLVSSMIFSKPLKSHASNPCFSFGGSCFGSTSWTNPMI